MNSLPARTGSRRVIGVRSLEPYDRAGVAPDLDTVFLATAAGGPAHSFRHCIEQRCSVYVEESPLREGDGTILAST